jgi:hypothetical protein
MGCADAVSVNPGKLIKQMIVTKIMLIPILFFVNVAMKIFLFSVFVYEGIPLRFGLGVKH